MRIRDKATYEVTVYTVPPFPAYLEPEADLRSFAGDEPREFLEWWCEAASARGWRHPGRPLGEEWVHARRLVGKYSVTHLKHLAISYFPEASEEWHGVKLLRGFVVWLRQEGNHA